MAATKASKPAESVVQVEKYTVYKPTNVRDDGKVLYEHRRRCTRLIAEARVMRTLLERRERLPQLAAELVRTLHFVVDIGSTKYWSDVSVHSDLDSLQNCVHKSITVILEAGTYDQICIYLSSLNVEVSYLLSHFSSARDVFIGYY